MPLSLMRRRVPREGQLGSFVYYWRAVASWPSPLMTTCGFSTLNMLSSWFIVVKSIRFAPPLIIDEEDLKKAVKIIGKCLAQLDVVSFSFVLWLLADHAWKGWDYTRRRLSLNICWYSDFFSIPNYIRCLSLFLLFINYPVLMFLGLSQCQSILS